MYTGEGEVRLGGCPLGPGPGRGPSRDGPGPVGVAVGVLDGGGP
jgi:hypothetical protein